MGGRKRRTIMGLDETLPERTVPGLADSVTRAEGGASSLAEGHARMRAFESGHVLQGPLGPPQALRAVMGMQRHLGEVGRFASFSYQRAMMPCLGQVPFGSLNTLHRVADFLRQRANVSGPQISTLVLSQQLREALGAQFEDYVSPALSLATRLQVQVPEHQLPWREHLLGSVGPTLELHAALAPQRVALLAFQEQPQLGASLSWLTDEDRSAVAALVPEGPRLPRVTVTGEVVCAVCGDELLVEEQTLRWRGPRGSLETRVFPFCVHCFRSAGTDEDFLEDVLAVIEDFDRPLRLETFDGEGRGDGVRRGQLHLVPRDCDARDDDE